VRTANGMPGEARRLAIVDLLRETGSVKVSQVEERFGVSSMTIRRDLSILEREGVARRTHGGAVLGGAPELHPEPFSRRVHHSREAKLALAAEAVKGIAPGETVFLDASSTSYFVARQILEADIGVTLLTNSVPIMALIARHGGGQVELIGIGGTFQRITRCYIGPHAVQSVGGLFADRLYLSCRGVTADGVITDAGPLEAEVKRAMIRQAGFSTLLIDRSKLSVRGLSSIGSLSDMDAVVAHGVSQDELARLGAPQTDD
jgi:DeoR/GlpR family transcriptional regulator of sugar metabolism